MDLHLVDATYELFRAHYAPRPPVHGRDGLLLSGVSGVCEQMLFMLREEGATHVGCATDQVIESFRNELYPGYKTSAGMPADLLAQFPIVEDGLEALGLVVWPMVEWEADDAIGAAVELWADHPQVERVLVCTPDKDMAQLVRDERVVLWDRRRRIIYDDAAVREKWGVAPESIPDWLALVGDAADGYPGIPGFGAKTSAALLAKYGHFEAIPVKGSDWGLAGVRNPVGLAQVLRERLEEALLYRSLARLRTGKDGLRLPQRDPEELEWRGAPRAQWQAFCDGWGLDRLRDRPHRWAPD